MSLRNGSVANVLTQYKKEKIGVSFLFVQSFLYFIFILWKGKRENGKKDKIGFKERRK